MEYARINYAQEAACPDRNDDLDRADPLASVGPSRYPRRGPHYDVLNEVCEAGCRLTETTRDRPACHTHSSVRT